MPRGGKAGSNPETSGPRIGRVVGIHGLKGEIKVHPLTDFPSRFAIGEVVLIKGAALTIERSFWHKGQVRLKLTGVSTPEEAEALRGAELEAADSRLELDQDEYLTADLIGMSVVEEGGDPLGVVEAVLPAPAADILQVGQIMIPAVRQFVLQVDASERVITVRLIPGMKPGEAVEEVR